MRDLEKIVNNICRRNIIPAGFGTDQCNAIIDAYNELRYETKCFIRDRQVYCFLKKKLHFPAKDKGNNLFVVWQKDLITVVK